jgi:DNA polymerase-3 subunit gamma/tau
MAYTVLARKYRPQTFSDLVGQEHVSRTIANAIATGRVAHAFLLTGARGVGKTTTARLLAKAMNCERGPTAEPCNQCDPCTQIAAGNDIDVLEIDGASNNGVDDVRRLQESLPYRPVRDRFKVVIVDEVHMLSAGAFNAFLKTLEEPPPHVKFIFATTEAHKVPVTIRSRCQRHDFRLFTQATVAARVREILSREGIEADDEAIAIVAREAAGSMRDALTVLDQLLAFGNNKLVGSEVAAGLGIADRKNITGVADAVLSGDAAGCMRAVAALVTQGSDLLHFSRQLLSLLRDLVVLRVVGDDRELLDLSEDERQALMALAQAHAPAHLERTFSGIAALVEEIGQSSAPQLVLEMGLVRLAERPVLEPLTELLARLTALEAKLTAAGAGSAPRGPGGGGGGGGGQGFPRPGAGGGDRPASPAPAPRRMSETPEAAAPVRTSTNVSPSAAATTSAAPAPAAAPRASVPEPRPSAPPVASAVASAIVQPAPEARAMPRTAKAAAPALAPAPETQAQAAGSVPDAWRKMVELLHDSQPALCAVLEHGTPSVVNADRVVVTFPEGSFFGKQAKAPAAQSALADVAAKVLGARPKIEVTTGGAPSGASTVAAENAAQRELQRQQMKESALAHPGVRDAMSVFPDAEVHVEEGS